MKKTLISVITVIMLAVFGLANLVGCGGATQIVDTDQHLEMYVLNIGLGYDWAPAIAEAFGKEEWVKEKYPNFTFSYNFNDDWDFASDRLKAGKTVNTADILFGTGLQALYNRYVDGVPVLEDLDVIANEKVVGEDVIYKDKIYPEFVETNKNPETGKMCTIPWGIGYQSIVYNQTLLNLLGFEVPVTTDEFINILKAVKNRTTDSVYGEKYAIIGCYQDDYWANAFPTWWAQYEGLDEYTDYFRGLSEGRLSKDIFKQTGRLKSLQTMEEILTGANEYLTKNSGVYSFMEAQTNFLMGKGIFYMCGDWFDYEMRAIAPSLKKTYNYDMRLMRMPVISSIREKTSITNDETLAAVIRAIDAGKTYEDLGISGVSESDYNTVFKARNIHNLGGGVSNMAVPSYASAKELALDFVRYFATDKAQEIFIEKTYGGSSGFIFDLKVKNPSLYDKVSLINRDKFDFISDKNVTVMPGTTIYPLVYKGGLGNLHAMQYDSFAHKFGTPDATTDEYVTGESLYNADIEYYTESRWKVLLSMSGY